MSIPAILSLATGLPAQRYSQAEVFEYLQPLFTRARHARSIFTHSGIEHRSMVVDRAYYTEERRTENRNERYLAEALPLGELEALPLLEGEELAEGERLAEGELEADGE